MPSFKWTDVFSVGVRKFDDQHRQLFFYVNELSEAMLKGKGKTVMAEILDGLLTYTETHFSDEEQQMHALDYAEYDKHRAEHAFLIQRVREFKKDFDSGNQFISAPVLQFMKDWLVNHILVTDKRYTDFFKSKGLS